MRQRTLTIGCRGENAARAITIDVSEILTPYPNAVVTLMLQRPTEGIAYPATTYTVSGDVLTWLPTDVDTAIEGIMQLQVVGAVGGVVVKTMQVMGVVLPALGPSSMEYPEPIRTWMNALQEMLTYAAKLEHVSASSATLPPGSAASVALSQTATATSFAFGIPQGEKGDPGAIEFAAFEIDEDGHIIVTYTDDHTVPLFEIGAEDGHIYAVFE